MGMDNDVIMSVPTMYGPIPPTSLDPGIGLTSKNMFGKFLDITSTPFKVTEVIRWNIGINASTETAVIKEIIK
jgi:hypothetical protein